MLNNKNPTLAEGEDFSTKSTANTGFNTNPMSKLGRKLVQELIDSGISVNWQGLLNYSNVNREECFKLMGYRWTGWVVLYKDLDGNPYLHNGKPFYRFKPDAGQLTGDKPAKYLSAKGSGCRPYFSPLLKQQGLIDDLKKTGDVIWTEGEKKADSLVFHGFTAIGIAGVDCWRDGRSTEMLPELEAMNWRGRNVFILFDSDLTTKDSVKRALKALACKLTEKGANVRIATLPHDLDGTKNGADDFLVKYGREALKEVLGIARPSHKNKKFNWQDEPEKSHHTAVLAAIVFKKFYALRPDIGLYKWVGTNWELQKRTPKDAIINPLHKWLDAMNWEKRENHHLASVVSEVIARIEQTKWDSSHLMSFKNGTLNVNNQNFTRSHDRNNYLTHSFEFKYDEGAKCPTWIKFLNDSFGNNQELIELLKAAFKWSICPKDTSRPFLLELFFDLYGRRGSGKGTTLEVLKSIAGGKHAIGTLRTSSLIKPAALFGLIGKKIAIDNDASGRITDAGIFNSIVSNEEVEVKKLYLNETSERLGVVVWRAFNDNPTASGGGVEGLGRRMVTFKFERPATNPDPYLKDKLFDEVAGIFQWCWKMDDNKMFNILKNRGNIAAVTEASIENQLDSQPVLQFIFEEIANDVFQEIKASNLYSQYQDWCKDSGRGTLANNKFGKELNKMEGLVGKTHKTTGNFYQIAPKGEFDLGHIFGISTHGTLNPPSCKADQPDPSASNPHAQLGKEPSMKGMTDSNTKNSSKEEKDSIYIKKVSPKTFQAIQPSIIDEPVIGSAWDTGSEDDDPHWG